MSKQILVVDDDAGSRTALENVLRDEGFSVLAVDSGRAALEYLYRSPPPQLIVLDLMMPDMDGWDLRQEQKRDPQLAGIPVIAVSAAGKLLDADASFRKPVDLDQFLEAVHRCLGPSRRERPQA